MGYLVNRKDGLTGSQGKGYDYIWAGNGLFVQAENEHLTARVRISDVATRGLSPVSSKLELRGGRIPSGMFSLGLDWMIAKSQEERFFAVAREGEFYRLLMPEQSGTNSSLSYTPPGGGVVAEFHSHGSHRAFFSSTDDRDEQGFRVYGVVGRTGGPEPEIRLRAGVYGHWQEIGWSDVFEGPCPGLQTGPAGMEKEMSEWITGWKATF